MDQSEIPSTSEERPSTSHNGHVSLLQHVAESGLPFTCPACSHQLQSLHGLRIHIGKTPACKTTLSHNATDLDPSRRSGVMALDNNQTPFEDTHTINDRNQINTGITPACSTSLPPISELPAYRHLSDMASVDSNPSSYRVVPNIDHQKRKLCSLCDRWFVNLRSHFTKSHPNTEFCISACRPSPPDLSDSVNIQDFGLYLSRLRRSVPTLRRVPRGARAAVARALSDVLRLVVKHNDVHSWMNLFLFPYAVLRVPSRSDDVHNLTSWVKRQVLLWEAEQAASIPQPSERTAPSRLSPSEALTKKAEAKLADCDVIGAIRLLSSPHGLAAPDQATLTQLLEKHPPHPQPSFFPPEPQDSECKSAVTLEELQEGLRSFAAGSAGGLDGLRPQILKDLLACKDNNAAVNLQRAMVEALELISSGNVVKAFRSIFSGAALTALAKGNGGVRPIAIGNVWRRLSAKIWCQRLRPKLDKLFCPHQVGVGISGGAEAGAHAARTFYSFPHQQATVFLKLDFNNAFNELRRDILLSSVRDHFPDLYPFIHQSYAMPSDLFYHDHIIPSCRGIQQGDPLGPFLFALSIHPMVSCIATDFNLWYLDDGVIGGPPSSVLQALTKIQEQADNLGLTLNYSKCELSLLGSFDEEEHVSILAAFSSTLPGLQYLPPEDAQVLGAPLTDMGTKMMLRDKKKNLEVFLHRLEPLSAHSAFYLLRASFAIPRLIFYLRCAPCWRHEEDIISFDQALKTGLESILNIALPPECWSQVSLPVRMGGLGLRRVEELTLPTFLASFHQSRPLVSMIIPALMSEDSICDKPFQEAERLWSQRSSQPLPLTTERSSQKAWDTPLQKVLGQSLKEQVNSPIDHARWLAVSSDDAGAWLNAIPTPQLGLHLPDELFRVAVALRLGANVCQPHRCPCGMNVDLRGLHGLSCAYSAGRLSRHAAVNDLILRALRSAEVPSIREPLCCSRTDGKRPDGMTLIPWKTGRALLWDFTCSDTYASSYVNGSCSTAGSVASRREADKRRKYEHLTGQYHFVPIVVETAGTWGREGLRFLKELGRRLRQASEEPRSTTYLLQRISMAVQRGNGAAVLGTLPPGQDLDEIFRL